MENNLSASYMGVYKVFCFSDLYLSKFEEAPIINYYKIGDFIPTAGYGYIYGPNLLIMDYLNRVIHIIVDSRYHETIKIEKYGFEIKSDSFLNNDISSIVVIDIYGSFLNINSVEDIVLAMTLYPRVNLYFNKKNVIGDNAKLDRKLILKDMRISSFENRTVIEFDLVGDCKNNLLDDSSQDKLIRKIAKEASIQLLEEYSYYWVNNEHKFVNIRDFMIYTRLLYIAEKNNIMRPFSYSVCNKKYATHIGKLNRYLNEFVLKNELSYIENILETLFTCCEFEPDYENFIIEKISIFMSI